MKRTTKGWTLCVQWKDKSMCWEKLSNMKESYPIEVAEYATALGIQDEPTFDVSTEPSVSHSEASQSVFDFWYCSLITTQVNIETIIDITN